MELVKLSTGVSLQVDLTVPPQPRASEEVDGNKLAVCLHPWSWLGGQMDDPVLLSLVDHLEGQHYHVLRFNSRGVGKSTGWASFTGFNEADDLGELVKWALGRIPDVSTLVLVGYSHGSLIASLQPIIQTVRTLHVLISYPLGPRGFLTLFHTSAYVTRLKQLVQDIDSKVLILYGDQDDFTAVTRYRAWKENLQGEAGEDCEDRLKFVEIAGGSHFWRGQAGQRLWEEVRRWLP